MKRVLACIITVCLLACCIPAASFGAAAETTVAVGDKFNAAKYLADEVFPNGADRTEVLKGSVWNYKLQAAKSTGETDVPATSDPAIGTSKGSVIKKPSVYSYYSAGSGSFGNINGVGYWDGNNETTNVNCSLVGVNTAETCVVMNAGGNWQMKNNSASIIFTVPATGKITLSDETGGKFGSVTGYLNGNADLSGTESRLAAIYYDGTQIWPAGTAPQVFDATTKGVDFPSIADLEVTAGKKLEIKVWRESNDVWVPITLNPTVTYTEVSAPAPGPGPGPGPDPAVKTYEETYTAVDGISKLFSETTGTSVDWKNSAWRATQFYSWDDGGNVTEQAITTFKTGYVNGGQTAGKTVNAAYGSGDVSQGASVMTDGKDFLVIKATTNWKVYNQRYELQFVAPKSGTVELTDLTDGGIIGDGDKYYKFGSYSGTTPTACNVYITYDGNKVWPENADYVSINSTTPYIEFPDVTLDVKTGKTLAIVVVPTQGVWQKMALNPTVGYTKIVADEESLEPEGPKYSVTYLARESFAKSITDKNQDDAIWQMNASGVAAGWQYETLENGKLNFKEDTINGEKITKMFESTLGNGDGAFVAPGASCLYTRVDASWKAEFKTLDIIFNPQAAGSVVLHDPDGGNWGGGTAYPKLWSYAKSDTTKTRISIWLGEEKVWPANEEYAVLSAENPFVVFPELTLYVTKFTPIKIHMEVEAGAFHMMGFNPAVSYLDGVAGTGDSVSPVAVGVVLALELICPIIIIACLPKKRRDDAAA